MPVYIIRAGDTDKVKIGWADEDPEDRRRVLQTAHYEVLTLLRVVDGPRSIERWMHHHFAKHHVRGEWYVLQPEMFSITIPTAITYAPPPVPNDPNTLAAIEAFLKRTGMTATGFGKATVNDPGLVHKMRKGRECRSAVRHKIFAFINSSSKEAA